MVRKCQSKFWLPKAQSWAKAGPNSMVSADSSNICIHQVLNKLSDYFSSQWLETMDAPRHGQRDGQVTTLMCPLPTLSAGTIRQAPAYFTQSASWLLMAWQHISHGTDLVLMKIIKGDSTFVPRQWCTVLLCNHVFHLAGCKPRISHVLWFHC